MSNLPEPTIPDSSVPPYIESATWPALESLSSVLSEQSRIVDSIVGMIPKLDVPIISGLAETEIGHSAESTAWFNSIHTQLPDVFGSSFDQLAEISQDLALQNTRWLASIQPALPIVVLDSLTNFALPAWFADLAEIVTAQISGVLSGLDWDYLRRRTLLPANWPMDFEDHLPAIEQILNTEGLPLAWVPRQALFLMLVNATSAEERLQILRDHRDEVLQDCATIIENLENDFMAAQIPLAQDVISACRDGHWRVAAVSAVVIVHAVVENLEWSTNPQGLVKNHGFATASTLEELIERSTRAPFVSFYVEWHPKSGKPEPRGLARNMVSHRVTDVHLDEHNCLIAVMLMASLMETVRRLSLGHSADEAP
ncbi:hypothetical protein AB0O95_02870 [Rhodoglobus sp. NPDC076762]